MEIMKLAKNRHHELLKGACRRSMTDVRHGALETSSTTCCLAVLERPPTSSSSARGRVTVRAAARASPRNRSMPWCAANACGSTAISRNGRISTPAPWREMGQRRDIPLLGALIPARAGLRRGVPIYSSRTDAFRLQRRLIENGGRRRPTKPSRATSPTRDYTGSVKRVAYFAPKVGVEAPCRQGQGHGIPLGQLRQVGT